MAGFPLERLRIAEFNVENLFLFLDRMETPCDFKSIYEAAWQRLSISLIDNKPLKQTLDLARATLDLDADIVMLCELGGRESLENFAKHFLHDQYRPLILEGNSSRGIDLGFLVRKSLPCVFELVSHKERPLDFLYPHEKLSRRTGYVELPSSKIESHRFSRDVLELRLYGASGLEPKMIFLLVHLKSQLDRDRIDPYGRDRRKAELEKLVEIYGEIRAFRGKSVPIVVAGDLNGHAGRPGTDAEFEALYRDSDLVDALELAGADLADRFTHMQIHGNGVSRDRQLDYILVSPELAGHLVASETFVYRFKDSAGAALPLPRTFAEKRFLPSDHFPVVATFAGLASLGSGPASANGQSDDDPMLAAPRAEE